MACIHILVVWGLMLCSHHCVPMFQWNMLSPSPGPSSNKGCVSLVPIFSTTPIFFFSVFYVSPVTNLVGVNKAAFYPHISLCCSFWPKLDSFSSPPSMDFPCNLPMELNTCIPYFSDEVGGSTFLQNVGIF